MAGVAGRNRSNSLSLDIALAGSAGRNRREATGRNRSKSISLDTASTSTVPSKSNNYSSGRPRSNSYYHRDRSKSTHRTPHSKKDLWKGSVNVNIGNNVIVQMIGLKSPNHTSYARVDPRCSALPATLSSTPLSKVIEVLVDESHSRLARAILEKKVHVEADSYPSAEQLLQLGSVWLLNETSYASGDSTHARRLSKKDSQDTPEWKDMTLRVHFMPDRFHVAHEFDWTKYDRGLLLNHSNVMLGKTKAVVPFALMPDGKDGVIVYEDKDIGFTIINKPGGMPSNSSISNHAEDVASMYGAALQQRSGDEKGYFLSFPLRIEPEMNGLMLAATKKEFCSYMTKLIHEATPSSNENISSKKADAPPADPPEVSPSGITKTYRCLVCIKDADSIDQLEQLVGQTIAHYVNVQSPAPKRFTRNKAKPNQELCLMKIVSVGGSSKNLRAACVSSQYSDSSDATLAHRLWGPTAAHPAESIGVRFVMQLDVELLTSRPHQLRGQLAALGVPIVGDGLYGGGVCEMRGHRHMWRRMAVQICHLSFNLPRWEEVDDKKVLVTKDDNIVCDLNEAWWSAYLNDYERFTLLANGNVGL